MWGLLDDMFGASPHTHDFEDAEKREQKCEITSELYDILHEFEALQNMMLPDTYVTLDNPYEWHALIFPQTGFFEGARLNFSIHMGAGYPQVAPTLHSDMPHPLVDPNTHVVNLDAFKGSHRAISLLQFARDMYLKPEYLLPEEALVCDPDVYATFCKRPCEMKQLCKEHAENSGHNRGKLRCGIDDESIPLLVEALGHPGSDNHKDAAHILTEWFVHDMSLFGGRSITLPHTVMYASNLDSPVVRDRAPGDFAGPEHTILKRPSPRRVASSNRIERSRSNASRGDIDEASTLHRTISTSFKTYTEEHSAATDELLTQKLWVNAVSMLEEEAVTGGLCGSVQVQDLVDGIAPLVQMRKDSMTPTNHRRTRENDRAKATRKNNAGTEQEEEDQEPDDVMEEEGALEQWSSQLMAKFRDSSTNLRRAKKNKETTYNASSAKDSGHTKQEKSTRQRDIAFANAKDQGLKKTMKHGSVPDVGKTSTSPRVSSSTQQLESRDINQPTRSPAGKNVDGDIVKKTLGQSMGTQRSSQSEITGGTEGHTVPVKPLRSPRTSGANFVKLEKEGAAASSSATAGGKKDLLTSSMNKKMWHAKMNSTGGVDELGAQAEPAAASSDKKAITHPSDSHRTSTPAAQTESNTDTNRKGKDVVKEQDYVASTSVSAESRKQTSSTLDVKGASESKERSSRSSRPTASSRKKTSKTEDKFIGKEENVATSSITALLKKTKSGATLDVTKASKSKERSSTSSRPSASQRKKTSKTEDDSIGNEKNVATSSITVLPKKTKSGATLDVTRASESKERLSTSSKASASSRKKTSKTEDDFIGNEENVATSSTTALLKKTKSGAMLDVTWASESKERLSTSSKASASLRKKTSKTEDGASPLPTEPRKKTSKKDDGASPSATEPRKKTPK